MLRGGKKAKLSGRKNQFAANAIKEVKTKQPGQDYARVLQKLGGCRFKGKFLDYVRPDLLLAVLYTGGRECLAILRGKLQKKLWVNAYDIILVETQDYQRDKVYIMYRYTNDEVRWLVDQKEVNAVFCETGATDHSSTIEKISGFEIGKKKDDEFESLSRSENSDLESCERQSTGPDHRPFFPNSDSSEEESNEGETFFNPNRPCQ